jgi:hypothetical protein
MNEGGVNSQHMSLKTHSIRLHSYVTKEQSMRGIGTFGCMELPLSRNGILPPGYLCKALRGP